MADFIIEEMGVYPPTGGQSPPLAPANPIQIEEMGVIPPQAGTNAPAAPIVPFQNRTEPAPPSGPTWTERTKGVPTMVDVASPLFDLYRASQGDVTGVGSLISKLFPNKPLPAPIVQGGVFNKVVPPQQAALPAPESSAIGNAWNMATTPSLRLPSVTQDDNAVQTAARVVAPIVNLLPERLRKPIVAGVINAGEDVVESMTSPIGLLSLPFTAIRAPVKIAQALAKIPVVGKGLAASPLGVGMGAGFGQHLFRKGAEEGTVSAMTGDTENAARNYASSLLGGTMLAGSASLAPKLFKESLEPARVTFRPEGVAKAEVLFDEIKQPENLLTVKEVRNREPETLAELAKLGNLTDRNLQAKIKLARQNALRLQRAKDTSNPLTAENVKQAATTSEDWNQIHKVASETHRSIKQRLTDIEARRAAILAQREAARTILRSVQKGDVFLGDRSANGPIHLLEKPTADNIEKGIAIEQGTGLPVYFVTKYPGGELVRAADVDATLAARKQAQLEHKVWRTGNAPLPKQVPGTVAPPPVPGAATPPPIPTDAKTSVIAPTTLPVTPEPAPVAAEGSGAKPNETIPLQVGEEKATAPVGEVKTTPAEPINMSPSFYPDGFNPGERVRFKTGKQFGTIVSRQGNYIKVQSTKATKKGTYNTWDATIDDIDLSEPKGQLSERVAAGKKIAPTLFDDALEMARITGKLNVKGEPLATGELSPDSQAGILNRSKLLLGWLAEKGEKTLDKAAVERFVQWAVGDESKGIAPEMPLTSYTVESLRELKRIANRAQKIATMPGLQRKVSPELAAKKYHEVFSPLLDMLVPAMPNKKVINPKDVLRKGNIETKTVNALEGLRKAARSATQRTEKVNNLSTWISLYIATGAVNRPGAILKKGKGAPGLFRDSVMFKEDSIDNSQDMIQYYSGSAGDASRNTFQLRPEVKKALLDYWKAIGDAYGVPGWQPRKGTGVAPNLGDPVIINPNTKSLDNPIPFSYEGFRKKASKFGINKLEGTNWKEQRGQSGSKTKGPDVKVMADALAHNETVGKKGRIAEGHYLNTLLIEPKRIEELRNAGMVKELFDEVETPVAKPARKTAAETPPATAQPASPLAPLLEKAKEVEVKSEPPKPGERGALFPTGREGAIDRGTGWKAVGKYDENLAADFVRQGYEVHRDWKAGTMAVRKKGGEPNALQERKTEEQKVREGEGLQMGPRIEQKVRGLQLKAAVGKNREAGAFSPGIVMQAIADVFKDMTKGRNQPAQALTGLTADPISDFAPKAEANSMFGQPWATDWMPIIGRAMGGSLARLKGKFFDVPMTTLYVERSIADTKGVAYEVLHRGEFVKAFKPKENGDLAVTARYNPATASLKGSDVLESLQKDPNSYILTTEQRSVFNRLKADKERLQALIDKYGLYDVLDDEGRNTIWSPRIIVKNTRPNMRGVEPRGTSNSIGTKPGFTKGRFFREDRGGERRGWDSGLVYEIDQDKVMATTIQRTFKAIADKRFAGDPVMKGFTYGQAKAYVKAMNPGISRGEVVARVREWRSKARLSPALPGRLYSVEDAAAIEKELQHFRFTPSPLRHKFIEANSTMKAAALAYDFGVPFIQLLPMMTTHPVLWSKAVTGAFRSFGSKKFWPNYMKQNKTPAMEFINHGGKLGVMQEMLVGLESEQPLVALPRKAAKKLGPIAGAPLEGFARLTEGFGRHFQTALDVAKVELWKALREQAPPTEYGKLVKTIEAQLGSGRMESMGMTPNRVALERALLMASSYYRGALQYIAALGEKGISRREALKSFGSYLGAGALLYVAGGVLLGVQDWEEGLRRLNPTHKRWMMWTIESQGQKVNIGLGGFYRSLGKYAGNLYKTAVRDPKNLYQFWDKQNPTSKLFSQKMSPALSMVDTLWGGEDWLGRRTGAEGLVPKTVPIALQDPLFRKKDEPKTTYAETAASMAGLTTYPDTESRKEALERIQKELKATKPEKYGKPSDKWKLMIDAVQKYKEERPPLSEAQETRYAELATKKEMQRKFDLLHSLPEEDQQFLRANKLSIGTYNEILKEGELEMPMTEEQSAALKELLRTTYMSRIASMRKRGERIKKYSQQVKDDMWAAAKKSAHAEAQSKIKSSIFASRPSTPAPSSGYRHD